MVLDPEFFSTAAVPAPERAAFWNMIAAETFSGMRVDIGTDRFEACFARWTLGKVSLMRPQAERSRVTRLGQGARNPGTMIVHLQHRGFGELCQGGRTATMSAGEMIVCDATKPYTIEISDRNDCLVVQLEHDAAGISEARVAELSARTLAATEPRVALLRHYLVALWDQAGAIRDGGDDLGGIVADMVALALQSAPAASRTSEDADLRTAIVDHIDRHLTDPDLGTSTIAAAFGSTPRAVQALFAQMGTTPTRHITTVRLRRAADLLASRDRSVTDIAFDVGFNDSAYFSRAFRRHFGEPPIAWRRACRA